MTDHSFLGVWVPNFGVGCIRPVLVVFTPFCNFNSGWLVLAYNMVAIISHFCTFDSAAQ